MSAERIYIRDLREVSIDIQCTRSFKVLNDTVKTNSNTLTYVLLTSDRFKKIMPNMYDDLIQCGLTQNPYTSIKFPSNYYDEVARTSGTVLWNHIEKTPFLWLSLNKVLRTRVNWIERLFWIAPKRFENPLIYPGPFPITYIIQKQCEYDDDDDDNDMTNQITGPRKKSKPNTKSVLKSTKLIQSIRNSMNSHEREVLTRDLYCMLYNLHPLFYFGMPEVTKQYLNEIGMSPFTQDNRHETRDLIWCVKKRDIETMSITKLYTYILRARYPPSVPLKPRHIVEILMYFRTNIALLIIRKLEQYGSDAFDWLRLQWWKRTPSELLYVKPSSTHLTDVYINTVV